MKMTYRITAMAIPRAGKRPQSWDQQVAQWLHCWTPTRPTMVWVLDSRLKQSHWYVYTYAPYPGRRRERRACSLAISTPPNHRPGAFLLAFSLSLSRSLSGKHTHLKAKIPFSPHKKSFCPLSPQSPWAAEPESSFHPFGAHFELPFRCLQGVRLSVSKNLT